MTKNPHIVIIDYGIGNTHSVVRAFAHWGASVSISDNSDVVRHADAIVMPGVGSFLSGMRGLEERDLIDVVSDFAGQGRPVLGICLGAQILLSKGYEFGEHNGLGIIKGSVSHFPDLENKEKVPHVGWNALRRPPGVSWDDTILRSTREGDKLYFVHSYILQPNKQENVLALTTYGGYEFCSAVRGGNVYGVQFHPEKSGEVGLNIIREFINLSRGEAK